MKNTSFLPTSDQTIRVIDKSQGGSGSPELPTDTMIFLKKQELMLSSENLYHEGKEHMLLKEYKDAIKCFT